MQRINADPTLLAGMRVEFTFEDVGCRTYKAVTGVQKLLSDPKIDAVVGPGAPPMHTSERCLFMELHGSADNTCFLLRRVRGGMRGNGATRAQS